MRYLWASLLVGLGLGALLRTPVRLPGARFQVLSVQLDAVPAQTVRKPSPKPRPKPAPPPKRTAKPKRKQKPPPAPAPPPRESPAPPPQEPSPKPSPEEEVPSAESQPEVRSAPPRPASPEPPESPPPEPQESWKERMPAYLAQVRARVAEVQRYPRIARRMGWEGVVVVVFEVQGGGKLGEVRVEESSGYRVLDEEAVAAVRRAAPLPEPPEGAPIPLFLRLRVVFRLEGSL